MPLRFLLTMMRRLIALAAVVSLLLCAMACVLWVRSYGLTDQLFWRHKAGLRCFGSAQEYVVVQLNTVEVTDFSPQDYGLPYVRMQPYSAPHYPVAYGKTEPADQFVNWELGNVGWYTVRNRNGIRSATGVAPFWCIAAATAMLPLGWTILRLRSHLRDRRRNRVGRCRACGYDLRASPERCPECGLAVKAG